MKTTPEERATMRERLRTALAGDYLAAGLAAILDDLEEALAVVRECE